MPEKYDTIIQYRNRKRLKLLLMKDKIESDIEKEIIEKRFE